MRPSPEIREKVRAGFQRLAAKDLAGAMAWWTSEPGAMFVATDSTEWITTRAGLEQVARDSLESNSWEVPDDLEIVAYEEGTVGWANLRYTEKLPNGGSLVIRWTNIYHQESGQWKVVTGHVSFAVPDEQVMSWFAPA